MPAGGGPRAAREIQRLSPGTRVIALSAFEDRPTVLEMLRAGARRLPRQGHRRRGHPGIDPPGRPGRHEPLGRGRRRHRARALVAAASRGDRTGAARGPPRRDPAVRRGRGDVHGVPADRRPRGPRRDRGRGARAVPVASPCAGPTSGSRRPGRSSSACNSSSRRSARRALGLPKLPPGSYLSVNCSHRAARSPELAPIARAGRRTDGRGDHRARARRRLRRARAVRWRRSARSACGSRSTTPAPGTRACATPCRSRPTS